MKRDVLISCGGGRLHFVEAAEALVLERWEVDLVCGVLPNIYNRVIIAFLGCVLGKPDLCARIFRRYGNGLIKVSHIHPNAAAEYAIQLVHYMSKLKLIDEGGFMAWAWRFYGSRTRRYLGHHRIYHVRSGAGQGGAIKTARHLNMRVVVDQSIAHPAFIHRALIHEYVEFNVESKISGDNKFWQLVLEDCKAADILLLNSDFVKETFVAEGFPSDNIRVVYLGVRADFFSLKNDYVIKDGRLKLLFTGTFELRKGLAVIIRALLQLKAAGVDVELFVAGDAQEARRFFAEDLKNLSVTLLGALPQARLKTLFSSCDLYVFPTYAEGCAKSAMEAMAAGLPVITTRACGLPGTAGMHYVECPSGDALALCEAIMAMGNNEKKRSAVGRAGAELVAGHYKWSDYVSNLGAVYAELLEKGYSRS